MSQSKPLVLRDVPGDPEKKRIREGLWSTPADWRAGSRVLTNETPQSALDWRSAGGDATPIDLPRAALDWPFLRRTAIVKWDILADFASTQATGETFNWELMADGASLGTPFVLVQTFPSVVVGANCNLLFEAALRVCPAAQAAPRFLVEARTRIIDFVTGAAAMDVVSYGYPLGLDPRSARALHWRFSKGGAAGKIITFQAVGCYQPLAPTGGWRQ